MSETHTAMRILCKKAIVNIKEFNEMAEFCRRKYPYYLFSGDDEWSRQNWNDDFSEGYSVAFYLVENFEGQNYVGFYSSRLDNLFSSNFFKCCDLVSKSELKDILFFKNNYTYRSQNLKSKLTFSLVMNFDEQILALP